MVRHAHIFGRSLVAAFGICAGAWAIDTAPAFRAGAPLIGSVQRIFSGDRFDAAQLVELRQQLDEVEGRPLGSWALNCAAIVRLFLLERELAEHGGAPNLVELQASVNSVLSYSPTSSFMWLTAFGLGRLGEALHPFIC